MSAIRFFVIVAAAILAASCGIDSQCESLSRVEALRMAVREKTAMLARATDEYAANFEGSEADYVRIGAETNGYAANVAFIGRDGRTLIALIESDCYIGWTESVPVAHR